MCLSHRRTTSALVAGMGGTKNHCDITIEKPLAGLLESRFFVNVILFALEGPAPIPPKTAYNHRMGMNNQRTTGHVI